MLVCHQAFFAKRTLVEPYNLKYRFSADFDWCIRIMQKGAHAAQYPPYDNRLSGRGNDYPEPESLAEGTFPHYDTALRPDKHRSTSHLVRTEGSAEKVILMTCQTGCAN